MRSKPHDERTALRDDHAKDLRGPGALVNAVPTAGAQRRGPRTRPRKQPFTDGPFAETKELLGGWPPPGAARR